MAKNPKHEISEEDIDIALKQLCSRLKERMNLRKGKGYYNRHEALGKITEEYMELIHAVTKEKLKPIHSETLDVAESAMYFLITQNVKQKR